MMGKPEIGLESLGAPLGASTRNSIRLAGLDAPC